MARSRHHPTVSELEDRTHIRGDGRPLLDIVGAAQRLGCSERFLRRLVQERRIPFIKLAGTRVRFVASDLDRWIESQRVDAVR
jgi:excisionase family DNA binding protein